MVFDRLCCRLQVYIGRIRGPSNTTANCYCPHLVKDIVEHIMVFLRIRKDFLSLSIHQKSSRFLPLSTYLHVHTVFLIPLCRTSPKIAVLLISCRERKKVFIRDAVSGKEWRKMTILQVPQMIFQTTRNADDRREESSPRKTSTAVTSRAIWWAGFVLVCEQRPPGERGGNWPEFSKTLHPKTHS